jgi:hypothetical protein
MLADLNITDPSRNINIGSFAAEEMLFVETELPL